MKNTINFKHWKNLPEDYRNILKGLGLTKEDYNIGIA